MREEETNLSKKRTAARTLDVAFYSGRFGDKKLASKRVWLSQKVRQGRQRVACLTFVLEAWRRLGQTEPKRPEKTFSYRRWFSRNCPPLLEVYLYARPKGKLG